MRTNYPDTELARIILKSAYAPLTPGEQEMLSAYLDASEENRAKYEELTQAESLRQKLAHYARRNDNQDTHFQTILKEVHREAPVRPLFPFRQFGWAAAVVLLVLAGTWMVLHHRKPEAVVAKAPAQQDVLPGKPGAVLTLSDGSHVLLDSMGNGLVARQQGSRVELQDGQLAYGKAGAGEGEMVYNTLSTPRGREFKIVLPDGTHAWLNSSSSIRYPIRFSREERVVEVTGEVYFEVAKVLLQGKKTRMPFRVKINTPTGDAGTVQVLGTHFNINAYAPKAETTLLEGSVRVTAPDGKPEAAPAVILKPGQQAQVTTGSRSIKTLEADVDKVMAWRRGFFNFDGAGLEEVMQELARWYDLEVTYEAGVPPITFEGELGRDMKLSSVLKALEESDVRFRLEGKKITVLP
ncbi:FecR domain-containing protein [Paraflavisolibacter sp. H34]|uniref:FecR family protein n=1 Tax=Huijunlia imazamoxiresistens TaxID=3127457 RepID=UPI00301A96B1